jgi:hypothetical protein
MYNYYVEKKKQEKKAISQDKEKKENKIRQKRKSRIIELFLEILENLCERYDDRVKSFVIEVSFIITL